MNEGWLEFHRLACQQTRTPRCGAVVSGGSKLPVVDVCVPYYNKPRHFPQLLESLERQTIQDFTVIAVDDGSPDPEARAVFRAMAEKYRPRGWTFFCQPNSWVDAARNQAAKRGVAEYLLMVDADDVPARNTVERMLEAARISGDDCLVCGSCLFAGDRLPYDPETGELTAPRFGYYMPLGANLTVGLLEPEVFGIAMILIRRKTFEALGGYRELRGAAHEDWELHARLALAGYKTDVLPEYLHFYRQLEDGLSRTSDDFLAKRRIIDLYDKHLASLKLYGAATAMYSLYQHCRNLERQAQGGENGPGLAEEGALPSRLTQSDDFGPRRFAKDDEGPPLVRMLRRTYRRAIPLSARLRFHERLMKLVGRDPRS
jgi:GT2 family glycosyltransferase